MDPLVTFNDDVEADAAAEAWVDAADLAAGLRCHQKSVCDYPGVDKLVYRRSRRMPRGLTPGLKLITCKTNHFVDISQTDKHRWSEAIAALDI